MKNFIYLLLSVALLGCGNNKTKCSLFPSTIDSLNSTTAIEEYIAQVDTLHDGKPDLNLHSFWKYRLKKLQDLKHENIITIHGKKIADSLRNSQSFYKADFDCNGYTDLVVTGYFDTNEIAYNYVLMNFGGNNIEFKSIDAYRHSFTVPKILSEPNHTFLQVSYPKISNGNSRNPKTSTVSKKLIYKFGGFIEYNPQPNNYQISKMEFSTSGCLGDCPVFQLILTSDQLLIYRPNYFAYGNEIDQPLKQIKNKLNQTTYEEIINLTNYLDFPNLQNYYEENSSDGQSMKLKIFYGDGKTKTIDDNLNPGTFGLRRLYEILFELKNSAGNNGYW